MSDKAIEEAEQRLCEHCKLHLGVCWYGFIPICSDGSDCPYFRRNDHTT